MTATILLAIALAFPDKSFAKRIQRYESDLLKVSIAGRSYKIPEVRNLYLDGAQPNKTGTTHQVVYKGKTYSLKNEALVDDRGNIILTLKSGGTENLGGIVAHGCMFWFSQVSEETDYGTSKPVTYAHVLIIKDFGGKFKLVKDMDIRPLIGNINYYLPISRYKDLVHLGGEVENYALLNLRSATVVGLNKGRHDERPLRDTSDSAISNSGRVFHQTGTILEQLSWAPPSWKTVRHISARDAKGWVTPDRWGDVKSPHDWITAVAIGNDDLLISNDLVTYAHKDFSYIPKTTIQDQRSLVQVFLKPGFAVGVIWRYDNERWENHMKNERGVLLSLPSLKPLCNIKLD
jgi:hypothetical protein